MPDAVAVESLFFGRNVTTALTVGQARGLLLLAAAQAGLPIYEYKTTEVKQALAGYGAADERQMQEMVRILLGLDDIPRPDRRGRCCCCGDLSPAPQHGCTSG